MLLVLLFLGSSSHCDATTNNIQTRATTSSTVSRRAVAELKMPQESLGHLSQHHLNQPSNSPTQPLVTQMQPPMLPPPPHPNFQSVDLYTQLSVASAPVLISSSKPPIARSQTSVVTREVLNTTLQYLLTEHQSPWTLTSSHIKFQHQVSDKLLKESDSQSSNIHSVSPDSQITDTFTETSVSQPPSNLPVGGPLGYFKLDSYSQTPTQSPLSQTEISHSGSVTQLHLSQTHHLVTESQFYQSHHEPTPTQISQTKLKHPAQPQHQKSDQQPSPSLSERSKAFPHEPFTLGFLPKFHLELSTTQRYLPSTQPSLITKPQSSQAQPSTMSTLPQTKPHSPPTQHPQLSTLYPKIPVIPLVKTSEQLNATQQGDTVKSAKSANDTEISEWLKRNTSQSPMTSNDPR